MSLPPPTPTAAKAPDAAGSEAERLRLEILSLVGRYAEIAHASAPFDPERSRVPVSGKVYDAHEMRFAVDAALDFWLTTGRFNRDFEAALAARMGVKSALTVNSGSSANLVAVTALTSPLLKDDRLVAGDEVITCATGFPTTVNPILQNGLVPVFVDVELGTYNLDVTQLEAALGPRTRAIVLAHALGNPFDLAAVTAFCRKHELLLVEDCCDALGATYQGRSVGGFGAFSTLSFYPAHHITTGEGGAVMTSNPIYRRAAESIRDWGRDCWCEPGCDNTCGQRFNWRLGELPQGYDHKYIYSHLGYNLKMTDLQAAVGLAQMDKLDGFISRRRANFQKIWDGLADLEDVLILPRATEGADPSWFGFAITLRPNSGLQRTDVIAQLNAARIDTRLLFGGNLVRQPYMLDRPHRRVGGLNEADEVMTNTFWVGVYPGLSDDHVAYMVDQIRLACGCRPL